MKIVDVEFMEPVRNPHPQNVEGGRTINRVRGGDAEAKLSTRAVAGMGIVIEAEGSQRCTIVPWGNVRFAVVEGFEEKARRG